MKYEYITDPVIIKQKLLVANSLESYLRTVLIAPNVTQQKRQDAVDLLASNGWNRRAFLDMCLYLSQYEDLSEPEQARIEDFYDDITEFRPSGNLGIVNILGEQPEEKVDFITFIYSADWIKSHH